MLKYMYTANSKGGGNIIKEIYNSGYYIDDEGNVYTSHARKGNEFKRLKTQILPNGYVTVSLWKIHKRAYVHRLVAEAFIDNPENKNEVNHKDLNKLNNKVSNLEWMTRKENENHLKDNNPCKEKTASNSGYLYHKNKQISHFRSLQQAKIFVKNKYGCTLCTIGNLNVNRKNDLIFLRDTDYKKITEVLSEREDEKIKIHSKIDQRNKLSKGTQGILYNDKMEYVNRFLSIREANQYLGHDLKKKSNNVYSCCGYTYIKCNDYSQKGSTAEDELRQEVH